MSEALQVSAEILKLARLLGRDPDTLGYLDSVPQQDIRALREQATDMLFDAHGPTLSRLAAGSKILPIGVVTMLGQRVFGSVLSARIAGLIDPDRAVEMAAKLPTEFLADIAIDIDPRRASDVIGRLPPLQIAAVAGELMRREEYVTMGRFVGHLNDAAINAALGVIGDAALLRVAFVIEQKGSLDRVLALLPAHRWDGIVDAAAAEDLWPQALDLLSHLDAGSRAEFARRRAAVVTDAPA